MLRKTFKLLSAFRVDKGGNVTSNEINLLKTITRSYGTHGKPILNPEDTFGTLASEKSFNYIGDEIKDEPEGEYFGKTDTIKKMKTCLDAHEYDNAKELLNNMQRRENAPKYAYNLLLNYNAKLGNIEEAFKLYNDYKKRGYSVTGAMYTSLFVACGNCLRTDIALPIAYKLAKYLLGSESSKPNLKNYHAMLKAFGRHGDLSAAFQLVDRLNQKRSKVITETYNMLLEACITDRASGLRFALLVWHDMLKRGIKPNIYTFKTMAKCSHTCSLGDIELVLDLVKMIVGKEKIEKRDSNELEIVATVKSSTESQEVQMLHSGQKTVMKQVENEYMCIENYIPIKEINSVTGDLLESESKKLNENSLIGPKEIPSIVGSNQIEQSQSTTDIKMCNNSNVSQLESMVLPNLLDPIPTCGSVIDFDDLSTPENRFMLFGGLKGFFKIVDHFNVKPDVKLFSILVNCIPPTDEAEKELMEYKQKYRIKMDVRLFNVILKKRLWRNKDYGYQNCVESAMKFKISPSVDTIGIFASSCRTRDEGKKCLELARSHKIRLSDKLLYPMLKNAKENDDLDYVSDILAAAKEDGVELSVKFLALLESTVKEAKSQESVGN